MERHVRAMVTSGNLTFEDIMGVAPRASISGQQQVRNRLLF